MNVYFLLFLFFNASIYTSHDDPTKKIQMPNYETILTHLNNNPSISFPHKMIQEIADKKLSIINLLKIFNEYNRWSAQENQINVKRLMKLAKAMEKNPTLATPSSSIPRFVDEDQTPRTDETGEFYIIE